MRPYRTLFRLSLGLAIFLGLDTIYMAATNWGGSDQNPILGGYIQGGVNLTDSVTVLVAAFFMLIIAIIAFSLDRKSLRQSQSRGRDRHIGA